jgi:hypothetical protein
VSSTTARADRDLVAMAPTPSNPDWRVKAF